MLFPSWFPLYKLPIPSPLPFAHMRVLLHPPTHFSFTPLYRLLPWGTKPPQDQGPPLPLISDKANMQLEPWLPPYVLLSWWLKSWELCGRGEGYQFIEIVVLFLGLQSSSAPSFLWLPWAQTDG